MRRPRPASPQQADFYEALLTTNRSVVLEAVAGAGKTTTLIQSLRYLKGNVFFGAYNKAIAAEIAAKVEEAGMVVGEQPGGGWLKVSTMHAAGFAAFRRAYPKVQVNEKKVAALWDDYVAAAQYAQRPIDPEAGQAVCQLVSLAKQHMLTLSAATDQWEDLADRFGVTDLLPEHAASGRPEAAFHSSAPLTLARVIAAARQVFQKSYERCPNVIDFDDMVYAPLAWNCRFFGNDVVIIDEAQDVNEARLQLALAMVRRGGRLLAVGDRHQAIYGFTGAMSSALDTIAQRTNALRLPLTTTYRCPQAVVSYVQQWVSHIQAAATAPTGEVRGPCTADAWDIKTRKPFAWWRLEGLTAGDAVLCRYNRPLVSTAYALLRDGIACRVEGREIGNGLAKLATRWKVKTLEALEGRLATWRDRKVAAAKAKDDDAAAAKAEDLHDTLMVMVDRTRERGKHTVEALVAEIMELFADGVQGCVVLASGHKSKGREWDRVFWLQQRTRHQPRQDWQREQEVNIQYVIGTRAKRELILVPAS